MPGDAALRLLIDIQARDSARGVIAGLTAKLFGLPAAFALIAQGAKAANNAMDFFIHGFPATGILNLKKGLADIAKGFGELALAALKMIAIFGLIAVVVGIAIGVKAVKAAADFQQGLNRLVTGAGDVTDNMQKMGRAILAVSVDTGVAAGDELKAMYLIISAHQRGAQAIDTLTAASKGAVIEQANVVDVANVLSGVMTNYGTKVFNATQFMNGLIQAVKQGKITLQDLSVAMGPIDPIAQRLGISFNDVAAAMTTQTNAMIPAARAATALRFLMLGLENPTKKAKDAMAALGLSSIAVAEEMKRSLPGALEMIYKAALRAGPEGSVPFNRAIGDMVGGIRGLTAFLALTGPHFKEFEANSKAILAAMKAGKDAIQGWDVAQSGFNVQLSRAQAAFQALLIVIGNRLLPILTNLLKQITPLIVAFAQWFLTTDPLSKAVAWLATAFDKVKTAAIAVYTFLVPIGQFILTTLAPVFQLIGKIITNILIPAWNDFITAIKPWVPDLLIVAEVLGVILVAAIITVIGVILLIIGAVLLVIGIFLALVAAILFAANWVRDKINWLVNVVVGFFKSLWKWLVGGSIIPDIVNGIIMWFGRLKDRLVAIVTAIINWIKSAWQGLVNAAFKMGSDFINFILNGLKSAWNAVVSWVTSALAWLKGLWPQSPVKYGPLKGSENWGYNFGMNIADGIRRSIPAVQSASSMLASAVGGGYSGSYSMSFGGSRYPTGGSVVVNHITIMPPDIKLDGASVVDKIGKRTAKEVRIQGIRNH